MTTTDTDTALRVVTDGHRTITGATGAQVRDRIPPMTDLIDAHLAHMRAGGLAENTVDDRRKVLYRVNKELLLGLEQATVEELADWMARKGWSAQTRATYYGHVRGFFNWACDPRNPKLDYDPSEALIRPKVPATLPRPVSDAELAFAMGRASVRWYRCVVLAAYAGLRCCELATITTFDVSRSTITVTGKGGKQRSIPTADVIWDAIRPLPPGPINPDHDADGIARVGNAHLRRIGLHGVTMHRFRHWFGTNLLGRGANLRTVQELMGHSSPATTAIYTLVTDEQRQIAIAALPALAPTPR
jgi:integrase/recombinase XerD